ncbi:DUF998 domain-containing protein [Thalassotalea euphylliae]|uniref:DUF998 domain-containing protein n=1 Tax=Thalassotalea euphylliae TaxID=1655234 RepID=UPI0036400BBC
MIILLILLYVFLWAGIFYFGHKRPKYSHIKHSISELAETGSTYEKQVSYGLFFPFGVGIMILAYSSVQQNSAPHATFLLWAVGLSYLLSAFFPCDPETPAIGSWKNIIHNIVGAGCYAAMLYQLNDMIDVQNSWIANIAFISLLSLLATFLIGWPRGLLGIVQRIAESSVFLTILLGLL